QMHGGIDSHLTLQNAILTGRVTNRLSYGLSDVYVLMTNSFVALGHISAGQTVQVKLPLNTLSANSGTALADQMASSKGLPTPYGEAAGSGGLPIQNELQRHLAILSALSDGAFPFCGQGPCTVPASGYVVGKRGGIFF